MPLIDLFPECPSHYLASDGDVISSPDVEIPYIASKEHCTDDCDASNDCVAFAYNRKTVKCYLITEIIPADVEYKDFLFCAKLDTGDFFFIV